MKITKETLKQLVMEELKATLDEQARGIARIHATLPDGQKSRVVSMGATAHPPSEEFLKKVADEEKAMLDRHKERMKTPYTARKANRAIAMANQHLKQVTKIMAQSGTGKALSGIEGAKAKDQLAQAIEQLQALDAYLEDITGESGSFSYHTDRGAPDKAVRQDVNPRPIRTVRGGTPRK